MARWDDPVHHYRLSLVVSLDRPARLFLCVGCRVQVVLCSRCDRGNPIPKPPAYFVVPTHWTGEQAVAVLEVLQVLRGAVWAVHGHQAQQAWCDQLVPDCGPPDFDPDLPF